MKLHAAYGHLNVNGLTMVSQVLSCDAFQLDLLFPHNFPCVGPVVLFSKRHQGRLLDAEAIELPWSALSFKVEALSQKLVPIIIEKLTETTDGTARPQPIENDASQRPENGKHEAERSKGPRAC